MINNDLSNQLSRFFNNRGASQSSNQTVNDIYKRLKARQDSIHGRNASADDEAAQTEETAKTADKAQKDAADTATTAAKGNEDENLSPMERRKKELKAIMDRLDAEEAQRNAGRYGGKTTTAKTDKTDANSDVVTTTNPDDIKDNTNVMGFLNDMPLFNEFKSSLMDAFKRLDGATAGSISAQYELNYSSMQYIANDAGVYEYQETNFSIKLDLNYIKAAGGNGQTGKDLADAIGSAEDFGSLMEALKNAGQGQQAQQQQAAAFDPKSAMASLQDYFSPEKTSGRILDFATAFFPLSDAFKKYGDTEEARAEFGELMRGAIQKGFDQAQGVLGAVPKKTQEGIDKTHELTMAGIDDFIKNGLNKQKQEQGVYDALEQFAFSFEMSYSKKTVTGVNYNSQGVAAQQNQTQPALDTQA